MRKLLQLIFREHKIVLTDRRIYAVALISPILYAFLFGSVYMHDKVTEVPIAIVDADNSHLSRSIIQALDANESFRVAGYLDSPSQFLETVRTDKAYACVYFPRDFERDVKKGRKAKAVVLLDGTNILVANTTYKAASSVIGTYSAGTEVKKLLMRGTPTSAVVPAMQPIEAHFRIGFNPVWNYLDFLLLGLIGTIMQQVTLLTVALGLSKEWEKKTSTSLREITTSPLMALAGKFLAYYTMMLPVCLISLAIPFKVFGALNIGSALLLAGLTAFFLVLLCFAGIAISGLTRDSLYTTQMLMIVAVPSFILSGYTWPAFAMPKFLQYLSSALPLTHYLVMVRKITMMGCDITYFHKPLEVLAIWTVLSILGAYAATTRLIRQG